MRYAPEPPLRAASAARSPTQAQNLNQTRASADIALSAKMLMRIKSLMRIVILARVLLDLGADLVSNTDAATKSLPIVKCMYGVCAVMSPHLEAGLSSRASLLDGETLVLHIHPYLGAVQPR